jgi:hypothetical protein
LFGQFSRIVPATDFVQALPARALDDGVIVDHENPGFKDDGILFGLGLGEES